MKAPGTNPLSGNCATDNKNDVEKKSDDDGKGGPLMGLRAALLASKEEIRQLSVVVHQQLEWAMIYRLNHLLTVIPDDGAQGTVPSH